MKTKFIEATQPEKLNWGKFMLARFDADEWRYQSKVSVEGAALLRQVGWDSRATLVVDLQTGEGAIFRLGGCASADLNKHQVWVCPMFEPFLKWLYKQDTTDLDKLPSYVEIAAEFEMAGYRRAGK